MPAIIANAGEAAAVVNGHIEAGKGIPRQVFFDRAKGSFWYCNRAGCWISIPSEGLTKKLRHDGLSRQVPDGGRLSPLEARVLEIQEDHQVSYAGPLAGHWAGLVENNGNRILVTSSPKLIEPAKGDWPLIDAVLVGLLAHEDCDQRHHFHGWLKVAEAALRNRKPQPGQVLCLAGPRECGKSLIQSLITEVLGGRSAKPFQYMTGVTPFNSDLFAGEHLVMEDDQPITTLSARRDFGSRIKDMTVNRDQRLHAKGRDAMILRPFWRVSYSLNDEPENLMALPPLDESIMDKISLFLCRKAEMPMPSVTSDERALFWDALRAELPAYVHWLQEWTIPKDLRAHRFGVAHWHHPRIVEEINGMAPEVQMLGFVDALLFDSPAPGAWIGTSEELQRQLAGGDFRFARQAEKLLSWNNAAGVYLGRLAHKFPMRVENLRSGTSRDWRILPP